MVLKSVPDPAQPWRGGAQNRLGQSLRGRQLGGDGLGSQIPPSSSAVLCCHISSWYDLSAAPGAGGESALYPLGRWGNRLREVNWLAQCGMVSGCQRWAPRC